MEEIYTVDWLEKKHVDALNKDKYDLTLKDAKGVTHEKVTMWSDFIGFSEVRPGSTVTGTITTKTNDKGYTNTTISPPKPKNTSGGNFGPSKGGFKGNMAATMATKQAGIEKSQDNKERGIILASTARMATDMVVALTDYEYKGFSVGALQKEWTMWRSWFAKNWGEDLDDITIPF